MSEQRVMPLMNLEFIKLCKAMRAAQREAPRSQREARRARSLEQVFDAKIERYEREVADVLKGLEKP